MTSNIEAVAREMCRRSLSQRWPEDALPAAVDRYWPVVAALIEAGVQDVPRDLEIGAAAWADWQKRHSRTN